MFDRIVHCVCGCVCFFYESVFINGLSSLQNSFAAKADDADKTTLVTSLLSKCSFINTCTVITRYQRTMYVK